MTLKEVVADAVEQLMIEEKREFTVSEICEKVSEIDPKTKRSSILSTLSSLVVGNPAGKEEDQFLKRVRRGVYKLYP